jgi:hypothetical protein
MVTTDCQQKKERKSKKCRNRRSRDELRVSNSGGTLPERLALLR